MKQNMLMIDRVIRVFVGFGIIAGAAALGNSSEMAWIAALGIIIGLIPIVTGFIGFCPAYTLFSRYFPKAPELTPAEKRHHSRPGRLDKQNKLNDFSGAEARMAGNQAAFRREREKNLSSDA
jgi:hypothetical protein